jgi:hypothetical protein
VAAGILATLGVGVVLAACGTSGTALAQQACSHVNKSITLLERSEHQSDPGQASATAQQAYVQLRDALPIAAEAAYSDGQWQSLMTTLSESNRVPEKTLISALTAQCQSADASVFGQAPAPSSIPPATAPTTSSSP